MTTKIFSTYVKPITAEPEFPKGYNVGMERKEIMQWRTRMRHQLLEERLKMSVEDRVEQSRRLALSLEAHCHDRSLVRSSSVVSGYWPLRGEPDLRPWLKQLDSQGVTCVLPVVVEKGAPLRFRKWSPGCRMERGFWNIPVPAAREEFVPDLLLAPLVGFDSQRYRLGYGGGYFDRTLALLRESQRAYVALGVGLESGHLATIHPLSHDIALDAIITPERVIA